MDDNRMSLSYAPPADAGPHPAAVVALAAAAVSLVLFGLAVAVARQPGPWTWPVAGRESATVALTGCSIALAAVATVIVVLGWAKRRRGAVEVLARTGAIGYWVLFFVIAGIGGALR